MDLTTVLSNTMLSKDLYLIRVKHDNAAKMGQFYMLRAWGTYPLLSRPISVFDSDGLTVSFLYRTVGEGTQLFSALREGDKLTLAGPYGNSFPTVSGRVAMVGGGVGIAPLYLAAKTLKQADPSVSIHLFLGFGDAAVLTEEFRAVCDTLTVEVGGYITDSVDCTQYDVLFSCGPTPMMKALHRRCKDSAALLYVSLESRMACGIGACLGCSCPTVDGNRRICKDGPVFLAREVF